MKNSRQQSLRRRSARVGVLLVVLVLAIGGAFFLFGGVILNRYGKAKVERAFAGAHPGYTMRIGKLEYAVSRNRLVAQSLTLSGTGMTLMVGRISLTGVQWARLLRGTAAPAEMLADARLEATNLDMEFPQAHYAIHCARLRASVPSSELIAEGTELLPLGGDEAFFAVHAFRTPRFHVVLPECRVLGLAYREAIQGRAYRAQSIYFSRPLLDALLNRDKPPEPFVKSPLMVHEALAALAVPLEVGNLNITNGELRYCERLVVGANPAVLTFGAVSLSAEGIANRGDTTAAIQVRGQGDLMNAATMQVRMTIPITPPDFSLHYSGSLAAMDLTRLDAFLEIAERTRIKSGSAQQAAFEIDVTGGQARGRVWAIYQDLDIAMLDKQIGNEKGTVNHVASFFVNTLKIRKANAPEGSSPRKDGEVNYARKPDDVFQQFAWFALRTGVLDIISH